MQYLMSGSPLFPKQPPSPPDDPPDPPLYVKGYRWPASRITKGDMAKLAELREQMVDPKTQLLDEAVATYYRVLMDDEQEHSRLTTIAINHTTASLQPSACFSVSKCRMLYC